MSKLTRDVTRNYELGDINEFPVLGETLIYQGAVIGLDVETGYVRPIESGDIFVGFAEDHIDNILGSDGAKNIRVRKSGAIILDIPGISRSDIGKPIYAENDNKFSLSSGTNNVYIGHLSKLENIDQGLVEFNAGRLSLNFIQNSFPNNKAIIKTDTPLRIFGVNWIVGASWGNDNYRANSKLLVYLHVPMRFDLNNIGGGYVLLDYSINDGAWQEVGHSGFNGLMSANVGMAGVYNNQLLIEPNMNQDYQLKFRLRHRSHIGSIMVNGNHGIWKEQYLTHLIIKEI